MSEFEYFRVVKIHNKEIIDRYCPICEYRLIWGDFLETNNPTMLWENKDIAIPCCDCFLTLKNDLDKFNFTPNSREYQIIKKNLRRFGLIE